MQYVYRRYGRPPRRDHCDRHPLSAALGDPRRRQGTGADGGCHRPHSPTTVWGSWGKGLNEMQVRQAGLDHGECDGRTLAVALATELIEFPRHLSQHVGGYVLTQDRLDYLCADRQRRDGRPHLHRMDKDDVDTLNMMKVDVLALGMLTWHPQML